MTQVKLWQIISQTANAIIFSGNDGNLKSLPAGQHNQVLVMGPDGAPVWATNAALAAALQAQTDATSAVANARAYTDAQITALVNGAPVALDTLKELADKLASEDSAINALITQLDAKAAKTDVTAQIAQAKQEAVNASATDATTKANAAQSAAIGTAIGYADQKATNVQNAAFAEAQSRANMAQYAAISTAAGDATTKVAALRDAIPGTFWVEGTSTACFYVSSSDLVVNELTGAGVRVGDHFSEVTGATIDANDQTLVAKMLFVNGVAMSENWSTVKDGSNRLLLKVSEPLAHHLFEAGNNSVMLLVQHKSYNAITLKA